MRLVTFHNPMPIGFVKSTGKRELMIDNLEPWLLSNAQLEGLLKNPDFGANIFKVAALEPRLHPFNASHNNVDNHAVLKRVLLYNGSGGYGDQIMTWPVASILTELGYNVSILADPGNTYCWSGLPWQVLTLPIQLSVFNLFDQHAIFEQVSNYDDLPDQLHPTDAMLHRLGLNPQSFLPEKKVVRPVFTPAELGEADKLAAGRLVGCYQLTASVPLRSLTPESSAYVLAALANAFPHIHWFALSDSFNDPAYAERAKALNLTNVSVTEMPLRVCWALIGKSCIVVAPDTMAIHAAGAQSVPCVGMFGPTLPEKRIKYYKDQVGLLWAGNSAYNCPFAPCHAYTGTWPHYCPSREQRKMCAPLEALKPEQVVEAAKGLLMTVEDIYDSNGNLACQVIYDKPTTKRAKPVVWNDPNATLEVPEDVAKTLRVEKVSLYDEPEDRLFEQEKQERRDAEIDAKEFRDQF